ncbi:MAG: hypothetical protein WBB01_21860 [Phormidesmis sp.]
MPVARQVFKYEHTRLLISLFTHVLILGFTGVRSLPTAELYRELPWSLMT